MVRKLKKSNFDKTQKLKLWQNWNTIQTKLKKINSDTIKFENFQTSFDKSNMTPQNLWHVL